MGIKMRRKKIYQFFKDKAFVIVLVVCFLSAVAMAGVYMVGKQEDEGQNFVDLNEISGEQLAQAGEEAQTDLAEAAGSAVDQGFKESTQKEEMQFGMDNVMDATDEFIAEAQQENPKEEEREKPEEKEVSEEEQKKEDEGEAAETSSENVKAENTASIEKLSFSDSDKLGWPVKGNILMKYSMDSTVYFATLSQYKYNPAIVIQGNVGDEVKAAAKGIVESITANEETGTTVTLDIGNGYKTVYGQLKDVTLKEGALCEKGSKLGTVNEPTMYYSVEGSNLYFKLLKDDAPVNPMNYLE